MKRNYIIYEDMLEEKQFQFKKEKKPQKGWMKTSSEL